MPHRVIVATFDNVDKAKAAAAALQDLAKKSPDNLKLHAGVIVRKDEQGEVSLAGSMDQRPHAAAASALLGALVGLFGGLPGAAIGAASGLAAGLAADMTSAAVDDDLVRRVDQHMAPGTTSIIVDADEGATGNVDDVVTREQGRAMRLDRS
jgi:uncharacterized membrane protein